MITLELATVKVVILPPDSGAPHRIVGVYTAKKKEAALERMWCRALLPEGAEVIQRVTARVLALRAVVPDAPGGTP